jgi:hypothetical protein
MKQSLLRCLSLTSLLAATLQAQSGEVEVKGVNPADNLTKFEILPKFTMIDSGSDTSIFTSTFKYDRAIQGIYGLNFDLPFATFESPLGDDTGIGDFNLRTRYQHRDGPFTYIAGLEAVFPTASHDTLGSGKYQINPVLAGVYAFSAQTFLAVSAKHLFSVAGESDRDDVMQGQYRIILAHTTPDGWWFLADPQILVDYHNDGRLHFAPEIEVGRMISANTGIWLRAGGHVAGDWQKDDWTVSGGIRFISF